MTLDDLEKIYGAAYWTRPELEPDGARRAGIAAVVRALRDEICHGYAENSARDLANTFNEILDSEAGDELAEALGGDA